MLPISRVFTGGANPVVAECCAFEFDSPFNDIKRLPVLTLYPSKFLSGNPIDFRYCFSN
jgi:hypothetical protein